jgi:enamine deaminase RidA (YjgF/YER057c/UK114 family)
MAGYGLNLRHPLRYETIFRHRDQLNGGTDMAPLEHPLPKGLLHNAAFSQVVAASGKRTIYTAGQVSIDERGLLVGAGDLAAQTAQAMHNVGLALAAAGAGYSDVVKITTYVVNYAPDHRAIIGNARTPFFANGKLPASTLIGVAALALPEWLVEIEAIAVVE